MVFDKNLTAGLATGIAVGLGATLTLAEGLGTSQSRHQLYVLRRHGCRVWNGTGDAIPARHGGGFWTGQR